MVAGGGALEGVSKKNKMKSGKDGEEEKKKRKLDDESSTSFSPSEDAYERAVRRAAADALVHVGYRNDSVRRFLSRASTGDVRKMLGDALIELRDSPSLSLCESMDVVLAYEATFKKVVDVDSLRSMKTVSGGVHLTIWRGDICRLNVDAIVNAANSAMLGCFQPSHRCIDNVIHRAAGPRLRDACRRLIASERDVVRVCPVVETSTQEDLTTTKKKRTIGVGENCAWSLATGDARITSAFGNLPSRYVIHTVGPIVPEELPGPSRLHAAQLAGCYKSCLELASRKNLKSVAICCISTGLFGYPQRAAATVALRTVQRWLREQKTPTSLKTVVFNCFLEVDHKIYLNLLHSVDGEIDEEEERAAAGGASRRTVDDALRGALRAAEKVDEGRGAMTVGEAFSREQRRAS